MDILLPIIIVLLVVLGKCFGIWLLSEIMNKKE